MWNIIKFRYTFLFIIVLFGCHNDNELNTEQSIIGTWQLIEIYSDPGDGSGDWNTVENGYIYVFTSDNHFTSNRFSECDNGIYSLTENKLTLDYDCDGFTAGIENPEGTFIEQITFESSNLILNPTYILCVEGCGWKFKKLK